jgi:cysteine dioxygenase
LSTHVESHTDFSANVEPTLSFQDLIDLLESQQTPPSLEQLNSWLERVAVTQEELKPYVGFKDANYWRHPVCRNEFVEMLVLCWGPGHRTPIHDHSGSHGAVKVFDGILWETTFTFDSADGLRYKSAREWRAGNITGAGVPDIHQLGNPDVSEQKLITIHVYAPPLGVLKTYKAGSKVISAYNPEETQS